MKWTLNITVTDETVADALELLERMADRTPLKLELAPEPPAVEPTVEPTLRKVELPMEANGYYCVNCDKPLVGRWQALFCSRRCSAVWNGSHRLSKAQPRTSPRGMTVVAGEGVRS
jgi:hypothetical protein